MTVNRKVFLRKRYNIQFPSVELSNLEQDEVYFYLQNGNDTQEKIRFHDYDTIYNHSGLYEQVFYDRLKCNSPQKVTEILYTTLSQAKENFTELRVLDLGAGNGMMGETLAKYGISRLVGVDIIDEAALAAERDRPGLYDAYYVKDLCSLCKNDEVEINSWSFNCLTSVAALGFGDIPPDAFTTAFNLIQSDGWIAFNIKETFLQSSDDSGFSKLIRELIFSKYLELSHLERYRHRLSMEGKPLYYYAIVAKKMHDIPREFLLDIGIG